MTRVIPWIFWRYGLTGYLHWAYARWSPHHAHERLRFDPYTGRSADDVELTNPWEDTVLGATWSCPPGDASMVYPPRDPLSNDPLILSPDLPDVFALYLAGIPPEPGTEDTGASVEDRNPRLEGVIDSIRWEQVRESIEDYGLLWMLSERIREAERDPNRAALAEQAQHTLDEVMDDVAPDWLNYTRDPAVISSARGRLAESIASLNTPDGPCGVGS